MKDTIKLMIDQAETEENYSLINYAKQIVDKLAITINAPRKIKGETTNPSPVTPNENDESPHINEPIQGPINIGINTCANILIPWNKPTFSLGVYFLMTVLNAAVAPKYPIIINKHPINIPISSLRIVNKINPIA